MKFTVNRSYFINNLNSVLKATSSRSTIPILEGIKMVLTDEGLVMTGSNTDISIELLVKASDDLQIA